MKIKNLVRIELVIILLILGGFFFFAGKTITGMVVHDEKETEEKPYDKIHQGMSIEEVRAIAGEPLDKQQTEVWYYEDAKITFKNGLVTSKAAQ